LKEQTKEWLGIKQADLILYLGFLMLIPVYIFQDVVLDSIFVLIGFSLCIVSCFKGMRGHHELSKFTNFVKSVAYPAAAVFFLRLAYLNYTSWNNY